MADNTGVTASDKSPRFPGFEKAAATGPEPATLQRDRAQSWVVAMTPNPSARPFIGQRATGPFRYGKWSRNGQPVIRALGRAWARRMGAAAGGADAVGSLAWSNATFELRAVARPGSVPAIACSAARMPRDGYRLTSTGVSLMPGSIASV